MSWVTYDNQMRWWMQKNWHAKIKVLLFLLWIKEKCLKMPHLQRSVFHISMWPVAFFFFPDRGLPVEPRLALNSWCFCPRTHDAYALPPDSLLGLQVYTPHLAPLAPFAPSKKPWLILGLLVSMSNRNPHWLSCEGAQEQTQVAWG
jgi:hypothetical protein